MKHSAVRATTASAASAGGERRDHELGDGANGADEPGFLKKGLEGRTRQQKPLTRILPGGCGGEQRGGLAGCSVGEHSAHE